MRGGVTWFVWIAGLSFRCPTQRSQNGTRKLPEIGLFLGKLALFELSCVAARRSLVENDRPPSFQGALDW